MRKTSPQQLRPHRGAIPAAVLSTRNDVRDGLRPGCGRRGCEGLFGPAEEMAQRIKARIKAETGLTASVGLAANKFLAKLASDLGKPDGLVVVPPGCVGAFLAPLPVGRLWGVGAKGEKRLHALGVRTIGQLAALPESVLIDRFGAAGHHLWQLAQGQDGRTVVPDREAKSISTETTFPQDIGDRQALHAWLLELVEVLAGRLRQQGLHARTVELKIRSSDFRTWSRSQALAEATNRTEALWQAAAGLFEDSLAPDMLPVRLLGLGASRLTRAGAVQGQLFDRELRERGMALDQAIDAIRGQFGPGAIRWGSLIDRAASEGADEGGG
jgi:DNA polymerase-4